MGGICVNKYFSNRTVSLMPIHESRPSWKQNRIFPNHARPLPLSILNQPIHPLLRHLIEIWLPLPLPPLPPNPIHVRLQLIGLLPPLIELPPALHHGVLACPSCLCLQVFGVSLDAGFAEGFFRAIEDAGYAGRGGENTAGMAFEAFGWHGVCMVGMVWV